RGHLYFVLGVSAVLFIASACFFYISDPWLAITPIPLTVLAILYFKMKQGTRMNQIIKRAAEIQTAMASKGLNQTEINKAVFLATTGELLTIDIDSDFNSFLKYHVLSWTMGYDVSEEAEREFRYAIEHGAASNHASMSDKIDAIAANYLEFYSKVYKK
ncbi:MAG: hypothetical protein WB341_09550, partial [Terracidiphilus sp.]